MVCFFFLILILANARLSCPGRPLCRHLRDNKQTKLFLNINCENKMLLKKNVFFFNRYDFEIKNYIFIFLFFKLHFRIRCIIKKRSSWSKATSLWSIVWESRLPFEKSMSPMVSTIRILKKPRLAYYSSKQNQPT